MLRIDLHPVLLKNRCRHGDGFLDSSEKGRPIAIKFGETVRLADDYSSENYDTSLQLAQTVKNQLVKPGEKVLVTDEHDSEKGTAGSVYKFIGGVAE